MINDLFSTKYRHLSDDYAEIHQWMWCRRCHRCYQDGEYRLVKGIKVCPYEKCTGLVLIDSCPWSKVQHENPDQYPQIPMRSIPYNG